MRVCPADLQDEPASVCEPDCPDAAGLKTNLVTRLVSPPADQRRASPSSARLPCQAGHLPWRLIANSFADPPGTQLSSAPSSKLLRPRRYSLALRLSHSEWSSPTSTGSTPLSILVSERPNARHLCLPWAHFSAIEVAYRPWQE